MTDKERLEETIYKKIKEIKQSPELGCNYCGMTFRGDHTCSYDQLKRRVHKLENINQHELTYRQKLETNNALLEQQNKRYREALEWYSENSPHGNIADEALEESE